MNPDKQEKLSKQGWKVGTVAEFLQLTSAEATCVELKLAPLGRQLEQCRQQPQLTSNLNFEGLVGCAG
jgi:hypothetical protein